MKELSIIVPVYNEINLLEKFIKNWNMIFICYVIGIVLGMKIKNFKIS